MTWKIYIHTDAISFFEMDLKCPLSVGKMEPAGARFLQGGGREGSYSVLVLEIDLGPALCSLGIFSLIVNIS